MLTALPYFLRKCLPGCRKVKGRFAMGWGSGGVYVSTSMSVCTCMCVCYVGTALHPAWLPLPSHFRVCACMCAHMHMCAKVPTEQDLEFTSHVLQAWSAQSSEV